jgi:capsular polysaccharide export protein
LQHGLLARGHRTTRIVFNGGDLHDAGLTGSALYRRSLDDWPQWVRYFAETKGVTDLVVYGDCRPYHRLAIAELKELGIRIHVLEEGYLRPNWVTCEADGVNGNSAMAKLDLDRFGGVEIEAKPADNEVQITGAHWRYILAGFAYYWWAMVLSPLFPRYVSHRELGNLHEAFLWLRRFLTWPARRLRTERALRAMEKRHSPAHLVLLQLNGDSQLKKHSGFPSVGAFVEFCCAEFAASGATGDSLVFKNHPLDNGNVDIRCLVDRVARRHGLADRVFFVETSKLVPLLENSVSVTAINSTACHQALRRSIPTMVLGRAVFNHPQIVPNLRLADFFRLRPAADIVHYNKLVNLLRLTCQFNGGFYTGHGRQTLLPLLVRRLEKGPRSCEAYRLVTPASAGVRLAS